jgi:hypothetical protein
MGQPMEQGCGAADPVLSTIKTGGTAFTQKGYMAGGGNGRVPMATGKVGTINAGTSTAVALQPAPTHLRFYKGSDGNLYVMDNQGAAWVVTAAATPPEPPIYAPTHS